MILCPVCGQPTGQYAETQPNGQVVMKDLLLIQFSYRGARDYVSQRCSACYDRMEARRAAQRPANVPPDVRPSRMSTSMSPETSLKEGRN